MAIRKLWFNKTQSKKKKGAVHQRIECVFLFHFLGSSKKSLLLVARGTEQPTK